ncbi:MULTISPECIES: HEAT repeat domain-containing protein [unclassified Paenibacillus]|uniref:HEAT repeat domain-containing protein n=1 Tax=unclassified Paenibacillus TaxID=185978 RepID=UPI0009540813|nr:MULTISPECIES: HEAT repeat domain-containing protein [unclassified Paenibacillus]ASS67465.1 HEAT repeat domain-containing protein [Paenibacillus sp. RUD330]SIQ76080.1 HEAT repeat [Paenibacillus sp. RU4X]SIQ97538.1 HEAT repeat [Paenibacillus sp. RU4T]
MTKQALYLLWISGGLISVFLLAIVLTWVYGHFMAQRLAHMNRKLNALFSSFKSSTHEEEEEEAVARIADFVGRSRRKKEQLIGIIIAQGENFIVSDAERLGRLYEHTGIRTYLIRQLASKRDYIQALGCRHLGDLAIRSAEKNIHALMDSSNNDVIYHALLALAKLGNPQSLAHVLVENSKRISLSFRAVVEILTVFKGSKEELFINTIELSDDYLKGILIKAAADYEFESLSSYYIRYLDSDSKNLRIASIRALGQLKDPAFEVYLIEMLRDQEWEVRAAAAKSLDKTGTSKSFEALEKMAGDREWWVRHNAAASLVTIPGGKEYAERILESEDQFAREAIIGVMERSV